MMDRKILAAQANEIGRLSRRQDAPVLTEHSAREEVAAWLQWCDPNGWHTDELAAAEGEAPYDGPGAWSALQELLSREVGDDPAPAAPAPAASGSQAKSGHPTPTTAN